MKNKNKNAQVWIETVVYTLTMLAIIGIVISVAKPALEQKQDKLIVEQSLDMINSIDSKIGELVIYGIGNTREISELGIRKGKLNINCQEDKIEFELDSKYAYSQPDTPVKNGDINILTEKKSSYYKIKLSIPYGEKNINITYNGDDMNNKTVSSSPTPYKMYIRNAEYNNNKYQIDFSLT